MNELYFFKKYLEEEMQAVFNNKNPQDTNVSLDVARVDNLQTVMRILGEYEHFQVNGKRIKIK